MLKEGIFLTVKDLMRLTGGKTIIAEIINIEP